VLGESFHNVNMALEDLKFTNGVACIHYWIIEAANGHTSQGVCRLCQQVQEFENSFTKSRWTFQPPNKAKRVDGQQSG
jgi:hypothetical protein